ncbi:Di-copper centre-containing protein [Lophium mytilinum]|uniref:Di-copper centre-containing protein n=1 Tax=Lophium mytilinum TaxID=390894 RepID=A0A6A6QIV8_9PEZI|nr:Di-copper centre-containing protein [Lophium mytilinum]
MAFRCLQKCGGPGVSIIFLVLTYCVVLAHAVASPVHRDPWNYERGLTCKKPIVRKEWRTLSKVEKARYLEAVQCFLVKPAITPKSDAPGVVSRYDDIVATHVLQTFSIHYVGHFLPWHRWFTGVYEKSLRDECGYSGAQPYWDWTIDAKHASDWTKSPVFDPVDGFGKNGPLIPVNQSDPFEVPGRTGGGCVADGAFQNMTVRMGPHDSVSGNPRCLSRDLSPYFAGRYLGMNQTRLTLSQPDFGWFDKVVEGGPSFDASGVHGGGHYGVGGTYGQMGDLYASPADPIFWMHHANLDRVWWSWQVRDLSKRLRDISGPINLMDYNNTLGGNVTLDFQMSVGVNAKNVSVRDTMDIMGGVLCYSYDKLY